MDALPIIYFLIAALTGFLAVAILLFYNREQRHSNSMLTLSFFALVITCLNLFLFYSRLILYVPWFYKISSPINLLVGPSLFIYVRASLKGELVFRKYDWLFLIPTIIHGVDLFPFYFMPADDKRVILQQYVEDPLFRMRFGKEGAIPQFYFQIFRVVWSAFFFLLAILWIRRFRSAAPPSLINKNQGLFRWLMFYSVAMFVMTIGMIIFYLLIPVNPSCLLYAEYWFGFFVLICIIGLFARPSVLYGLYLPGEVSRSLSIAVPESGLHNHAIDSLPLMSLEMAGTFADEKRETYKSRIESFIHQHSPYLTKGYGLEDLSRDIHIPKNVLSAFINQEYGIGFTHFINRYRISYILENKDSPRWKQITLESIGWEAGFGSKTAFFKAFRKETGMTPAQVLKGQQVTERV